MVRVLLAALIVAAFFMSPASAQDCEKPQAVIQMVMDRLPQVRILDPLTSTEIAAVIRGYNAVEPVSSYSATGLDVMSAPGFSTVLLIAHANGCVVFTDQVPIQMFLAFLQGGGA